MDEKILDGPRLFDDCCQLMQDGIRSRFPEYTEEQVRRNCDADWRSKGKSMKRASIGMSG